MLPQILINCTVT